MVSQYGQKFKPEVILAPFVFSTSRFCSGTSGKGESGKFPALLNIFSRLAFLLELFLHPWPTLTPFPNHHWTLPDGSDTGIVFSCWTCHEWSVPLSWPFCIEQILNIFYKKKNPEKSFLFLSLQNTHLPDHRSLIEFLLKIPESILSDNLV